MAKHPHINEVDRSYAGMCDPVIIKSVWEEGIDACKAFVRSLREGNESSSIDDQTGVLEEEILTVECENFDGQEVSIVEDLDVEVLPDGQDVVDDDSSLLGDLVAVEKEAPAQPEEPQEGLEQPPRATGIPAQDSVPEAVKRAEERARVNGATPGTKRGKQGSSGESDDPELAAFTSEEEDFPELNFDPNPKGGRMAPPLRPAATAAPVGGPPGKRKRD